MREPAPRTPTEIRDAVEDGKRRLARLADEGNALLLDRQEADETGDGSNR